MGSSIYSVNSDFFQNWNSKMAYVLGFVFSDGCVDRTTLSFELQLRDMELLKKIRKVMKSTHPIKTREKRNSARLRISDATIAHHLKWFGLTPNAQMKLPPISPHLFRHFARGFLDGDGWIIASRERSEICVGFSNGDRRFLEKFVKKLNASIRLTINNLRERSKTTKNKKMSIIHQIEWYGANAFRVIKFLYDDLKSGSLYLKRKYERQLKARKLYLGLRKGRKWRAIERKHDTTMKKLLSKLLNKKKLNGSQIAEKLGVSSATVYRWLEKTGVRLPRKKKAKEYITKCPVCGKRIERMGRPKKYCSENCRVIGRRTGKMVNCVICGKEIYRPEWWFKKNTVPLCSRACVGKWQMMRIEKGLVKRSDETGRFLPSNFIQEDFSS
ncbi:hypothetical protein AKJ44_01000 [candidate division MSBL1 archaeon SCGC-AAA261F17]|uniref:DOD-type homing endonuclease domain-containing protein n=1 Tax=candidate division MSBL1 archaeon SCGC-AAA261F17 TaxID=1698274 RepID=A0A133V705_9EURY|nr:hypothetical protein AKJ44_01000 [candidate division MSBL1 archaeon SCGC-AAA261F17]